MTMLQIRGRYLLEDVRNFLKREDGIGTVEIVLITMVLVGVVLLFQKEILVIVDNIADKLSIEALKVGPKSTP